MTTRFGLAELDHPGDSIRERRVELGWTQAELSRRTGIPQADISRIENGHLDARWSTIHRIFTALAADKSSRRHSLANGGTTTAMPTAQGPRWQPTTSAQIPTTTASRAGRVADTGTSSSSSTSATRRNSVTVERPRVELIDGKVLYDGRSLVSWASRVADRIVERCDASRIVLYGSVARGDDGPDSDIDLLVVIPIVGRRHDTSVRVLNELRDLPVPVDITVVDPAHLEEEASVPGIVRAAMREGRVLAAA